MFSGVGCYLPTGEGKTIIFIVKIKLEDIFSNRTLIFILIWR